MGVYKRTDISEDAVFDGFCFVDADELEVWVDTTEVHDGIAVVGIGTNDDEHFRVYARDIPKFIATLKEAYNYYLGESV